MFVNESGVLEAAGMIGDDNWMSFMSQMAELEADLGEAA